MHLTATPSGEVAQMLTSTTSKWGLNKEARAALLRREEIQFHPAKQQRKLC